MSRIIVAACFNLLLAGASDAQTWEVFNMTEPGLPSNTVVDIVTEPDGTVWIATDWGLCRRRDGEWVVFQESNSGLPDNRLRSLALDSLGRLWVGTSLGGAAIFDGAVWQVLNTLNSPLPDDQVNAIHVDHQGWVWLGTVRGLACFTGSEWRIYDESPQSHGGLSLNGEHILSIDSRADGLMALGTLNGGFHFLTDTLVQFFTTFNSGFFDNTQLAVLIDEEANERWLACPAGGLVRQIGDWYGGSWFQYTAMNSGLPSTSLKDVIPDGQGGLWLAAQVAGLIRRSPMGGYSSFLTSNSGIPSNSLNCVHSGADGGVWVGTYDGGAARFNPASGTASDVLAGPSMLIVPSPNSGCFRVSAPGWEGGAAWELREASGRLLGQGSTTRLDGLSLDFQRLPPGAYLLRAANLRIATVSRFMVH